MDETDPFSGQSSLGTQLTLDAVEFVCPACRKTPCEIEEKGRTITLRPCKHTFRRDDLTTVIEHLRDLDDLIQRHDTATTPLERQGIREGIQTVGAELDAATERCAAHVDAVEME